MLTSTKSLLPYLLLLLLPTVAVGWIGLSEMGHLKRAFAELRADAESVLNDRRDSCQHVLSKLIEQHLAPLVTKSRSEIEKQLRDINASGHSAVRLAFLMVPAGKDRYRAYYPRLPRSGLAAYRPYVDQSPQGDKSRTTSRVRDAELVYRLTNSIDARLEHLEHDNAYARASGNEFESALQSLELGATLKAQGNKLREALDELTAARKSMRAAVRGLNPLYLGLVLLEAECDEALRGSNGGPAHRSELPELALATLEGIANGGFDGENDDFLGMVYDKLERIAEKTGADSAELPGRLARANEANSRRVALRSDFEALLEELTPNILKKTEDGGLAVSVFTGGEQKLACVEMVKDDKESTLLAGLLVDLSSLYAEFIVELEEFLSSSKQWFRIQLVGDDGNILIGEEIPPEDAAVSELLRTSVELTGRLKDFKLVAVARNPQSMYAAQQKTRLMRMGLAIGLAIVMVAGAFLLIRTVRKETEIAGLKTSFVARVSHELKTPLALIRMYGETLAMGRVTDPEKSVEFAAIIAKEADRLTRMIDNVLDFSQIEAGTKHYEKVPTRLDVHIESLLRSYAPHLEDQGFELHWGRMPPLIVMVDPEGLTQAIVNLLGNAAKYTDAGTEGRCIEVELAEDGGRARISVLDRGIGVPDGERGRVFETFYRASTAGERRGVGLGLALVKHFAEAHSLDDGQRSSRLDERGRGAAMCEPRDGGGTVFSILLPLAPTSRSQRGD